MEKIKKVKTRETVEKVLKGIWSTFLTSSIFFTLSVVSTLGVGAPSDSAKPDPAKPTDTSKPADDPKTAPPVAPTGTVRAKDTVDETLNFLRERLRAMEASAEIAATFKEDNKSIALRFYRGKTVINLELDPQATDVYFDVVLKEVDRNPPEAARPGTGTNPRETPGTGVPPKGTGIPPVTTEPEAPRETLATKLREMIKGLEENKPETPGTGGPKAINPEILTNIYRAQRSFYAKNYKAALKDIDRSIELGETAIALALKGTVLISMGNKADAITAWTRALELDPRLEDVESVLKFYSR